MRFRTLIARRERALLFLASIFILFAAVTLQLSRPTSGPWRLPLAFIAWAVPFGVAHLTLCHYLPERDPLLLPVVSLLTGWGLLEVARLAPAFFMRQVLWVVLSPPVMVAVALIGRDLRWLRRFRYTWLLAGLALLAATLFLGVNPSGYGPQLWLRFGGVYLQPSEPLKLLMIVYLASYLSERRGLLLTTGHRIGKLRLPPLAYAGPLLVMFGLTILLLAWQQDLGAGMLFFFTFLAMLYLATGQWEYAVAGILLFAVAGVGGYLLSARVALRVDGWLNPWADAADRFFQIVQSLLAFGAGGVFGEGTGLGRPTYIPAVHTDFVFAAIAEEMGLVGALGVIGLYLVLMLRGFRAALRARQGFERLLAAGLTAGLVIQSWVIMAGNARVAPIAGVTLPFLSYGGSSLLSTFVAAGLLLRISNREERSSGAASLPDSKSVLHVAVALGLVMALLAVVCGYWAVVRADWLMAREDNPRRVEYEQRIQRGEILDRAGVLLAGTMVQSSGVVSRTYPVPEAAPVVGYASLRYGTGGIESALDDVLRGEASRQAFEAVWDDLLHRLPHGQDVQLTIDSQLQSLAQQALGEMAGAVVLMEIESGQVLAMASAPTFDPARLDQEWSELRDDPAAPLFNRATQGLYQPGAALMPVVLAEAVGMDMVEVGDLAPALTVTVQVDGVEFQCRDEPGVPGDYGTALRANCPGPFAFLGEQLGVDGIGAMVNRWGLVAPPPLELATESGTWEPGESVLEAVGQGDLTVSPLQMVLLAAAIANEGVMPNAHLVLQVEGADGEWQAVEDSEEPRRVVSPQASQQVLEAWSRYDLSAIGLLATAIAGEEQAPLAWFVGAGPAEEPVYAVVVLLEQSTDPGQAVDLGVMLLHRASGH